MRAASRPSGGQASRSPMIRFDNSTRPLAATIQLRLRLPKAACATGSACRTRPHLRSGPHRVRRADVLPLAIDPHDTIRARSIGVVNIEARRRVRRCPKIVTAARTRADDSLYARTKRSTRGIRDGRRSWQKGVFDLPAKRQHALPVRACSSQKINIARPRLRCSRGPCRGSSFLAQGLDHGIEEIVVGDHFRALRFRSRAHHRDHNVRRRIHIKILPEDSTRAERPVLKRSVARRHGPPHEAVVQTRAIDRPR